MPPNPPSNAHGFAMRSMSLRDMQIPKSEKKNSCPPPLPNPGDAPEYYKIWTLKKIRLIFQNFPKTVINDLNKLCFQNYCASLIKVVMKRNNLNCINHFLV